VLSGETAVGLERRDAKIALKLQSGRELLVDGVVAGIGIEANIALAQAAGLQVDDASLSIPCSAPAA
jgi:3-phenylpropionate/trans-cinnamate dioxygenase ferredoxin reductase component